MTEPIRVRIQHTSMQFSDDHEQHKHDALRLFSRARLRDVWACTGTEAGDNAQHHDLHDLLVNSAHRHGFYIRTTHAGEWVALNRQYLESFKSGFDGPFIPGKAGSNAPRGIAWASAEAKNGFGRFTFGAAHYLTRRSIEQTGHNNALLIQGIGDFGRKYGKMSDVCFIGADVNTDDAAFNVFNGEPFTSIADELGKHPPTHGNHAIDVIASYNHDRRVKGYRYNVYRDPEVHLFSDHFMLEADYLVEPTRPPSRAAVA